MVAGVGRGTLPAVLTDFAADLRAGRIGTSGQQVERGWADSGAMALTGHPAGPMLGLTVPVVARLDAALAVIRALAAERGHRFPPAAGDPPHPPVGAGQLLAERAATAGLTRGGAFSAGRAAGLLRAADCWVAVNLARPDDVDLLPAWLEEEVDPTAVDEDPTTQPTTDGPAVLRPWSRVAALVTTRPVTDLLARAELLGLPVARVADPVAAADDEHARARGQSFPFAPFLVDGQPPDSTTPLRPGGGRPRREGSFTVVDLSSLWAGPLCAHLLGLAGGRVVKVEGAGRLDGARHGPPAFYDLLHAGHASVTVDLRTPAGRGALVRLIESADVVIEASRPRAFEALGIDPTALLARNPALTWVSITGYGRTGPWRQRPAFGDDAAAAGGAVAVDAAGDPVFLADAIADPVTGILAAAGALASLAAGGGHHLDVALREAVGSLLAGRPALPDHDLSLPAADPAVTAPRARTPTGRAVPAGHDNDRYLSVAERPC
jgi:crotonobetainyl-CoA:carnitine CoA-transferase CaiB-like acyl-CoA transferase